MIHGNGHNRSLRRVMLFSAVVFGLIVTASALTFVSLSNSIRRELDGNTDQLMIEERIADEIVSSSYGQQLVAYRYLDTPSAARLTEFRDRGQRVYSGIRQYLFREMPFGSRLNVEAIREAHQRFEVAAQHAFDLLSSGDSAAARARVGTLTTQAAVLEQTVRGFIADREQQRLLLRRDQEAALRRLQEATTVVAIALALTAILLAHLLRRRVMLPLYDLSTAVRQLGEGVVHVRVAPQRYHEFQLLADSFDGMADSVRQSHEEVQARNRELTRTLDDLRRAQQELVQHEKLRAMGEMLAGLAHELNNPLAGILGIAECIKMDLAESNDPKWRELGVSMAEPLVTESLRARDLVRNLLHFARQSTEKTERVHLLGAVEVAIGLRRHAFAQAEKTIEDDVAGDLYVIAQAQKLQHAIINIANNALDALCEGDGTRLRITAKRDGPWVLLIFEDEGQGFRQPDRAFDPFYTTKPIGSGTGLGLALVHRFVQEFGGSVSADNAASGGARVTMRLQAWVPAPTESSPNVSSPRS
jgi:C4-dicarboxylate-specific signal transduction histidine kinase